MKVASDHDRRAPADNCIPVELGELLGSLAHKLTSDAFQVEINRRLGALLRVAGITLEVVPREMQQVGVNHSTPDQLRFSAQFVDGDRDLLFTIGLAKLSERSRQVIYDTAITVLTDFLKVMSLNGPVALQHSRGDCGEKIDRHLLNDARIPVAENPSDGTISASFIEMNPTDYTPPYCAVRFAHQLRNQLAAIMSGTGQLASAFRSHVDADGLLLVKAIENASVLQEELISRYLMSYGSMYLTLRSLDLGVALRSAVKSYDAQFGCQTKIAAEADRTEFTCDPEILRQIIVEVLRNAHEASGGEEVTLRWSVTDQQSFIMVKNRGHIKGADFDDIFDQPFCTTKSGHAGLGLCIARRYACYLGGTIKGQSLQGYTIVTICLPLVRNENICLDRERESQCHPY